MKLLLQDKQDFRLKHPEVAFEISAIFTSFELCQRTPAERLAACKENSDEYDLELIYNHIQVCGRCKSWLFADAEHIQRYTISTTQSPELLSYLQFLRMLKNSISMRG